MARSWCEQVEASVANAMRPINTHNTQSNTSNTLYNIHTGEPLIPLLHDIYSCISTNMTTNHHNYCNIATTTSSTYVYNPNTTTTTTNSTTNMSTTQATTSGVRCTGPIGPVNLIQHGATTSLHIADLTQLYTLQTEYHLDCIAFPKYSSMIDEVCV